MLRSGISRRALKRARRSLGHARRPQRARASASALRCWCRRSSARRRRSGPRPDWTTMAWSGPASSRHDRDDNSPSAGPWNPNFRRNPGIVDRPRATSRRAWVQANSSVAPKPARRGSSRSPRPAASRRRCRCEWARAMRVDHRHWATHQRPMSCREAVKASRAEAISARSSPLIEVCQNRLRSMAHGGQTKAGESTAAGNPEAQTSSPDRWRGRHRRGVEVIRREKAYLGALAGRQPVDCPADEGQVVGRSTVEDAGEALVGDSPGPTAGRSGTPDPVDRSPPGSSGRSSPSR